MDEKIKANIREIIGKNIELTVPIEKISYDDDLTTFGMNSITFIKVVVAIELEYGFEFEDDIMLVEKFKKINDLVSYIKEKATK